MAAAWQVSGWTPSSVSNGRNKSGEGGREHCRLNPSSLLISPLISFPHRSRTNLSLQRFYSEEGQRRVNTRDLGVYSSALWTELLMTHHCSQISADRPLSSRDLFQPLFFRILKGAVAKPWLWGALGDAAQAERPAASSRCSWWWAHVAETQHVPELPKSILFANS